MNFKEIETKWQQYWDNNKVFKAVTGDNSKKPYYILVEFPYPSGAGLHVGHVRSYTAQDAIARMKRMQGYNVLYPMGWDAFGAPAEQYAIKNHIHPKEAVKENIKTFKGQMKSLGFSFDWDREFSTTDPEYYKWTQWQFLQFYKHNMAYKACVPVNWCPTCKSVLSNEDAAGGVCERCGSKVVQKEKSQWMLRMSDYAEDLLNGLEDTHFAEKVKLGQINWIGKSEGANVTFKVANTDYDFVVYTTRPDTLFGVTYCVLSPEHELVPKITTKDHEQEVKKYQEECSLKNEMERTELNKEKTGVFTGAYAINPVNSKEIPIYISDYVLASYGTGAIMAVPAHDERDYDFAKKFNIPIIQVLEEVTGTPHDNEFKKNSIVAIVYDEANDKYLTINWHEKGGRLFIGGTIKDGEIPLECALREVKEETGYSNIELVCETPKINHHYYAFNKDKYFNIECTGFMFKLKDDAKERQNLDDDEAFDVEWVDHNTLSEIKDELHAKTLEYALNPGAMVGDGIHINSSFLDGLNKKDAIDTIIKWLSDNKMGERKVNYKMRDWIFSRQRFWGEPIPMINCPKCGWVPMDEKDLPLLLPDVAEYEPTDNGESPLAKIDSFVHTTCPKCGGPAMRETDTMPNWAGSSWYFLRFMDANNNHEFASMDAMKYWNKVNWYNGGMEHTARHLLYARFWVQFLYNIGLVPNKEMIDVRVSHGMVLGSNNEKMSKSKGNVINPDDIVNEYGADTLRVYELFMGDYEQDAPWNTDSLKGCKRFIDRVIRLKDKVDLNNKEYSPKLESLIHKSIKKVENDLNSMGYNTSVSTLMILLNAYEDEETISRKDYETLLTLLNPMAPHITEELNESLGNDPICLNKWPEYDEAKTIDDEKTIAVQINGKLRGSITTTSSDSEEDILQKAKDNENVKKYIEGKEIIKTIVIPGKIVNIVIKG